MEQRDSDVESVLIDPLPRRIYTIGGDIDAKPLRIRFDVIAKMVRMHANRIESIRIRLNRDESIHVQNGTVSIAIDSH